MAIGTVLIPFIFRGMAQFIPGLSGLFGGRAGGPAPAGGPKRIEDFPLLWFLIYVGGPLFVSLTGIALWAPVVRLWQELRTIERKRRTEDGGVT